jgi:3-deoxy-manno-octulosonate cytidylyltransferase (CMP-KDO synthetase)
MPQNIDLKFALIIPARFSSSRLPGKPLIEICGQSLVSRVWAICRQVIPGEDIYVATDDERIATHCRDKGIQTLMTSQACLTGTDRVSEASRQIDADIYINVQGDEPLLDPEDIRKVISASREMPTQVICAKSQIKCKTDFQSSTVPKVVTRPDGRLLYLSRAGIPTTKDLDFQKAYRQVCIYALPRERLDEYANLNRKTPLESIEDIEILRFLELGHEVYLVEVSSSSVAVDVPADIARVEALINAID